MDESGRLSSRLFVLEIIRTTLLLSSTTIWLTTISAVFNQLSVIVGLTPSLSYVFALRRGEKKAE